MELLEIAPCHHHVALLRLHVEHLPQLVLCVYWLNIFFVVLHFDFFVVLQLDLFFLKIYSTFFLNMLFVSQCFVFCVLLVLMLSFHLALFFYIICVLLFFVSFLLLLLFCHFVIFSSLIYSLSFFISFFLFFSCLS